MAKKKALETEKKEVKKKENIDVESLKKELNEYIDETVKDSFTLELEKTYKRIIREKNIKIIIKNMIITALLLIIVYLVYVLNDNNYFDKFFIEDGEKTSKVVNKKSKEKETTEEPEVKEPTLDELKEEYGYLLDNIYINEDSAYVEDYYSGNLSSDLKNYLTMNFMDIDDLSKEDDYNIIENDTFKKCYEKKFIGEYSSQNFSYNGNNFRYINKLDSYITAEVVKENETNIKRIITRIQVDEDNVIITTVEGLVIDNKLYNILTKEEVSEYSEKAMIENISRLNSVIYTFNEDDKLIKLDK